MQSKHNFDYATQAGEYIFSDLPSGRYINTLLFVPNKKFLSKRCNNWFRCYFTLRKRGHAKRC
jgi:hypothetical protein